MPKIASDFKSNLKCKFSSLNLSKNSCVSSAQIGSKNLAKMKVAETVGLENSRFVPSQKQVVLTKIGENSVSAFSSQKQGICSSNTGNRRKNGGCHPGKMTVCQKQRFDNPDKIGKKKISQDWLKLTKNRLIPVKRGGFFQKNKPNAGHADNEMGTMCRPWKRA